MTPFEIALKTEHEGRELYVAAHAASTNSLAREIFSFLIKEEQRHIELIEEYAGRLAIEGRLPNSPARIGNLEGLQTVFSQALKRVSRALPPQDDDMLALERAMQFEQRGEEYYTRAASAARDDNERGFFSLLAREEHGHYLVLLDSFEALKDPQAWQEKHDKIGLDGV